MRVIQLRVPLRQREIVREILERNGIEYIVTDATSEGRDVVVVQFPVPRQAVGEVLRELREAGVDVDDEYRVNLNAEIARASDFERSLRRLVRTRGNYLAHEELHERARELPTDAVTYYSMTMLGTVVATCGLLLNSAAVVVGSMVIAPQLGSALTAAVGITMNDREMIVSGLASQVLGLGIGLVGSTLFGVVVRWTTVVPPSVNITTFTQIGSRISPGLLSVMVGLAAGLGAAFSFATHETPSGPLVGIMVSAALIPAAANAGIGIAWQLPHVVFGSLVLLVVNVVCINLAGPVVLWTIGYRPGGWGEVSPTSIDSLVRYAPSLLTVLVLLVAVIVAGAVVGEQVAYEQRVEGTVGEVLACDEYEDLELQGITTEYVAFGLTDEPQQVSLVVIRATNDSYPELGTTIQEEVSADTGYPVEVAIEFVTSNETDAGDADTGTSPDEGSDGFAVLGRDATATGDRCDDRSTTSAATLARTLERSTVADRDLDATVAAVHRATTTPARNRSESGGTAPGTPSPRCYRRPCGESTAATSTAGSTVRTTPARTVASRTSNASWRGNTSGNR